MSNNVFNQELHDLVKQINENCFGPSNAAKI